MSALADHNSHFSAARPEIARRRGRFVLVQPQHFEALARQRVERAGRFGKLGLDEILAILLEPPSDAGGGGEKGLWLHSVGLRRCPKSCLGQLTLSRRLFDLVAGLLLRGRTHALDRGRLRGHVAGRGRTRDLLVL